MKVTAVTAILFATLALANPAPVAEPEVGYLARSVDVRDAAIASKIDARDPMNALEARRTKDKDSRKASKPKNNSKNNNGTNSTSAASTIAPSYVLELGALGFGVMEIVKLWG